VKISLACLLTEFEQHCCHNTGYENTIILSAVQNGEESF